MSKARIVFLCISVFLLGGLKLFLWFFFNKLEGEILVDLIPDPLGDYFVHILYGIVVFYLLTLWYTLRLFNLKV